ncbi:hypothetical protein EPI10_022056 [Gossypium australe]|uniref:Uncharacterized protein n=1 Tax=Gossypium australe TaxID=47621 RepID=A0A5B6WK38_9ROSI|nr:hypothetical protein EPI10_022056 [Gossypium australe]
MVGCLRNLYGNVENLEDAYILLKTNKDTLLKPKYSSSFAVEFLLVAKHGIINNTRIVILQNLPSWISRGAHTNKRRHLDAQMDILSRESYDKYENVDLGCEV